jgi:hypothetical protein
VGAGGGGVGGFGICGISGSSSCRRVYTVRMGQPTRLCQLTLTAAFPIRAGS